MKHSIQDVCMAHRYLYYVRNNPVISDFEYDMLEKEAVKDIPKDHPLNKAGSDMESSYSTLHKSMSIGLLKNLF